MLAAANVYYFCKNWSSMILRGCLAWCWCGVSCRWRWRWRWWSQCPGLLSWLSDWYLGLSLGSSLSPSRHGGLWPGLSPCPDSTLSSTCRLYRQHHGTSAACFSSQHTPRHRHQSTLTTQQNAGIGCYKVHSGNILKHSSRHLPGQSQVKSGKVEKSKDYWKEKEIYVSL